jgi:hypothetical protein
METAIRPAGVGYQVSPVALPMTAAVALAVCGPVLAMLTTASPGLALAVVTGLLASVGAVVLTCLQLWVRKSGFLLKRAALGALLFAVLLASLVVGLVWPRAMGLNEGELAWQDSLRMGLSLFMPAGALLGALVGTVSWRISRHSGSV